MTTHIETIRNQENQSSWKRFTSWINWFATAIDYDPHEITESRVSHIGKEVERLRDRVRELEGQSTCAVD